MKALVKARREPGLWLEEVPAPDIGPNDVLVRVKKTGICGTDLHIYRWDEWSRRTIPVPMVVGHECAGEIHAVGSHVTGFQPGDRVSIEGHITCGYCRNCRAGRKHLCRNTSGLGVNRPGCFAELVAVPAANVFKLAADIPDEVAAFLDPLGNAVHTALSFDVVGEDVLVTGAGPIGLMAAAVVRQVGARFVVITDVNEYRLDLARKMGVSYAVNPKERPLADVMAHLGMTEGFDVGLEMSGAADGFRDLLAVMNNGGRVAILGIPSAPIAIDWTQVIFKGLVLKGIYGREVFETWYKMAALLQAGMNVTHVLTHRFPAARFHEAFEVMSSGSCGKVILDWTG
ncbi:MAG TPA: L-threonine 3-dehydrogenase [Anaeromyxobacteraceae bacterium]|nr:L-threonine 3-dehydrogenase [Anaeromyxobacteraceae bacterium]